MHNCTPIKGECLNVCKVKVNAWFFDLWNDCYMHVLERLHLCIPR